MTLLYTALFIAAQQEENLKQAYQRITTTTASLTFNTFTAGEKGNTANSHLLVANTEALLVDAQLTKTEAKKLVKLVKKIGKPLKTIVITSAFPDRYLGLPILRDAFPDARVLASPGVAKDIKAQWSAAVEKARAMLPGEAIADPGEPPEAWPDTKLELAGNLVQVINADGAETEHAIALFVPSLNVLITGNLVNGNTHAPVRNTVKWLALLDTLRKGREVGPVLTGRGDVGDASLIDTMKTYLKTGNDKLRSAFPGYKAAQLLEGSDAGGHAHDRP